MGADAELEPLTSLLIARAQGNPFFLEESVRALAETGVLAGERGAYRLVKTVQVVQLPETVQAILAARIDRLPPEDKSLLQSASVVGKDVPFALVQAIAGVPDDALARGLGRLQSGEFIYETRLFPEVEYTFKHTLTHEVTYESLLHERRRALHAQVVNAIERLHPDALAEHRARLVHHAFRGEVWSKAITHLRDLSEVPSPAEIDEVMGVGPESPGQLWWMGDYDRAIKAAERDIAVAASFSNFSMLVVASCRLGQANHALGNYARAAELFRQTVDSLQGDLVHERFGMVAYPSVWARSWLSWSLAEVGGFVEAAAVGEEAAEIAASGDHPYSRCQASFGLGMLYVIQGRPDRAIPILEQGLVLARLESIAFFVPFIAAPLGAAYALAGRIDSGLTLLEQTVEQAVSIRLVANHSLRLAWLGQAHLLAGRRDAALESARRALHIAEERQERGQQAYVQYLLADIGARGEKPDVPVVEAAYRRALDMTEPLQMRPLAAQCLLGLGQLHQLAGQRERAREEIGAALTQFIAMGMTLWIERAQAELEATG